MQIAKASACKANRPDHAKWDVWKVSHIRSGWKWKRHSGRWTASLITLGFFVTACSRQWSCKALNVFRNEFHDLKKKSLGSNGTWHVGWGVIKQHPVNCFLDILQTLVAKRGSIFSQCWRSAWMMFSCLQWSQLLLVKMLKSPHSNESAAPVLLYCSFIMCICRLFCTAC